MSTLPELSKPEHTVLSVLWKSGELSIREVHDQVEERTQWAYNTTKTVMDRMTKKGLLERGQLHGVYIYRPLISKPKGLARMIYHFAASVLNTEPQSLVPMFTGDNELSKSEAQELKRLLKDIEAEEKSQHD